jgi:6-pyruvoyl-tetrahydropterin synthase
MHTLFLKDFTVLDCATFSPSQGLSGESLYVSAELEGELDEQGFILDFGPAKKWLKGLVDQGLDHKLLVPRGLWLPKEGLALGRYSYKAPNEAVVSLESSGQEVSIEDMALWLNERAAKEYPRNVKGVRFFLREDERFLKEANYRYTHGLRLHDGNCQRLFHGHRNPIEVWRGQERLPEAERWLAQQWEGVHFVARNTLMNNEGKEHPLHQRLRSVQGACEVAYKAPQGEFSGQLPLADCVMLDREPSIENIARVGWLVLREQGWINGAASERVVAYEGLNKGASYSPSP